MSTVDQPKLRTLTQTLRFPDATVDDLSRVLAEAPLIGPQSIFGERVKGSPTGHGDARAITGFRPAWGFRFDVAMRQQRSGDGVRVTVDVSQPHRGRPYLDGQFVWLLTDDPDGPAAVLREEINTPAALALVDRPVSGHRFSLKRYAFFEVGHERVMEDLHQNVNALLGRQ